MADKKMTTINLIKKLQSFGRGFFTIADLEKIIGLPRNSLKVALNRLTKQGVLERLTRGVYQLSINPVEARVAANQLYYPSYLSFEAALARHGILSQIPYTQTFATIKKSKKIWLKETEIEYTQIKKELFFGYVLADGIYLARPEKALLDQLYLVSRGKRSLNLKELDLSIINKNRLFKYAKKFPAAVQLANLTI